MFTTNVAVAEVTLPALSFVVTSVTVAVPVPVPSPPLIAVVSFEGTSAAVNVGLVGVGVVGDELPQPETNTPRANNRDSRFISTTPFAKDTVSRTYGSD